MKIIVTILLCIFSYVNFCFGQDTLPPVVKYSKQYYLQKSKAQKSGAWLLVGVAAVSTLASGSGNFNTIAITVPLMGVSLLGSLPLFIAASRNKRKSMHATVQFKMLTQPDLSLSRANKNIPAIGLRIHL